MEIFLRTWASELRAGGIASLNGPQSLSIFHAAIFSNPSPFDSSITGVKGMEMGIAGMIAV